VNIKSGKTSIAGAKAMKEFVNRLINDESGVTAIEYGLIAAGIGVAILTVVNTIGGSLNSLFKTVSNDLSTAAR
jgi:pilus assembly protein Flp/PilA